MVSTPNSQSIRLKRRTGEAWDFQQRIFIALKILNLFVILSGQKTLLACLCIPGPAELEPGGARGEVQGDPRARAHLCFMAFAFHFQILGQFSIFVKLSIQGVK